MHAICDRQMNHRRPQQEQVRLERERSLDHSFGLLVRADCRVATSSAKRRSTRVRTGCLQQRQGILRTFLVVFLQGCCLPLAVL
jgi:hypothetical protein